MKIPPDWTPGHQGYPLHLARTQLRAAAGLAERLLDMLDVPNGRQIVARALWDLAMQRDAERAVGTVHPLKILSD
jgi:hypothetical protein